MHVRLNLCRSCGSTECLSPINKAMHMTLFALPVRRRGTVTSSANPFGAKWYYGQGAVASDKIAQQTVSHTAGRLASSPPRRTGNFGRAVASSLSFLGGRDGVGDRGHADREDVEGDPKGAGGVVDGARYGGGRP